MSELQEAMNRYGETSVRNFGVVEQTGILEREPLGAG
jgi:hypothetical protein